jgi:DNA-binding NarL/FixJ family response regulator
MISGAVIERAAELGFVRAFLDEVCGDPRGWFCWARRGSARRSCGRQASNTIADVSRTWRRARARRLRAALSFAGLSERLGDVLRDAMDSLTEFAAELFMGVSTVESHLAHVYRRLGIRSRGALGCALGTLGVR